jgi:hypothetical protein
VLGWILGVGEGEKEREKRGGEEGMVGITDEMEE